MPMSGERLSSLGRRAFTRQETQALTSTFLLHVQRNLITLHLSFHSFPVFSLCLSYWFGGVDLCDHACLLVMNSLVMTHLFKCI